MDFNLQISTTDYLKYLPIHNLRNKRANCRRKCNKRYKSDSLQSWYLMSLAKVQARSKQFNYFWHIVTYIFAYLSFFFLSLSLFIYIESINFLQIKLLCKMVRFFILWLNSIRIEFFFSNSKCLQPLLRNKKKWKRVEKIKWLAHELIWWQNSFSKKFSCIRALTSEKF